MATAVWDASKRRMEVKDGKDESGVAWGSFADDIEKTGWGRLTVRTNGKYEDEQQAFGAGLVEGYLTQRRIRQFANNLRSMRDDSAEEGMRKYFNLQHQYLERKAREAGAEDGFWHHSWLMWKQFEGVVQGYNRHCGEGNELDAFELWLINMDGDNIELEHAVSMGAVPLGEAEEECGHCQSELSSDEEGEGAGEGGAGASDPSDPMAELYARGDDDAAKSAEGSGDLEFREQSVTMSASDEDALLREAEEEERVWRRKMRHSRCTALVKALPDLSDVLVAHTSWEDYVEMMRIFKHYVFNYKHASTKATGVSFSSYPGMISSTDDYYVTSARLLITETTVNLMKDEVLSRMHPSSLASWIRSMVASRIAEDAPGWARAYSRENSGTYNCHWMIVDYNLLEPGKPLKPNTLYVVETVPGLAVGGDMTSELERRGYWPSVNRPFFRKIRREAGYREGVRLVNGVDFLSFEENPRGQQLRKLHGDVKGSRSAALEAMKSLIRHNDVQGDPLQRGKASYAIAARYDLEDGPERAATGATDAKVAGRSEVLEMKTHAVCGPTTNDGNPPFSFAGEWAALDHEGLPETYDFDWEIMQPF